MKSSTAISILVASALAFTSMSTLAQQGHRGGAGADRAQQVDRDRTYDRDRMSDRDRAFDRDRARDRDRIETPERDRDRDRIHDPANLRDQDIYGNEFMSVQERNEYREQLRLLGSEAERQQLQAQHREQMNERARALNLDIEEAE